MFHLTHKAEEALPMFAIFLLSGHFGNGSFEANASPKVFGARSTPTVQQSW